MIFDTHFIIQSVAVVDAIIFIHILLAVFVEIWAPENAIARHFSIFGRIEIGVLFEGISLDLKRSELLLDWLGIIDSRGTVIRARASLITESVFFRYEAQAAWLVLKIAAQLPWINSKRCV
jgi:hypothetical protein